MKKSIIRFISTLLVVMLLSESLSFVAFANDKSGGYVETHHQFNMEDINAPRPMPITSMNCQSITTFSLI